MDFPAPEPVAGPTATPPRPAAVPTPFLDSQAGEDSVVEAARARALAAGIATVSPSAGAALAFLAAAVGARSVAETGTGAGVSGLWLLRGMRRDGVLTTIDAEAEHLALARTAFAEAGVAPNRTRLITSQALEVLPRLADGGYDLVHLDAAPTEYDEQVTEALRLLRPGGVLVVHLALSRLADPSARDPETAALRAVHGRLRDDEDLVVALLPLGDGLLAVTRR